MDPQSTDPSGMTCFVIGPIGDKFADPGSDERLVWEEAIRVLEHVIQPACDTVGLVPIRSDSISQPGEIPEQVFELLRDSDVVIADLTGGNANVMYELGLRHTTGKCTVSLAERARIPFDVSVIRTIVFQRTPTGFLDARDELAASLRECIRGNHRPVTAARLWAGSPPSEGPPEEEQPTGDDDEQDEGPYLLERLARMEEALPHAVTALEGLTAIVDDIGALMREATAEIEAADQRGGGQTAALRLTIARRVGKQLDDQAAGLEAIAAEFESDIEGIDGGLSAILEAIEADPSRIDELGTLPATIDQTAVTVQEAMQAGNEMADVIAGLASLARPLRKPSQRVAAAVRRVSKASTAFQVWAGRFRRYISSTEAE